MFMYYFLCFCAGGYIIPAILHFARVWDATGMGLPGWPRLHTTDRLLTAFCAAISWPFAKVASNPPRNRT